jgi:hypothetical protein
MKILLEHFEKVYATTHDLKLSNLSGKINQKKLIAQKARCVQ